MGGGGCVDGWVGEPPGAFQSMTESPREHQLASQSLPEPHRDPQRASESLPEHPRASPRIKESMRWPPRVSQCITEDPREHQGASPEHELKSLIPTARPHLANRKMGLHSKSEAPLIAGLKVKTSAGNCMLILDLPDFCLPIIRNAEANLGPQLSTLSPPEPHRKPQRATESIPEPQESHRASQIASQSFPEPAR